EKSLFHGQNPGMSTTAVQSGTVHGLDLSVSANNPCPRSVRARRRGHKLSASANASQFRQSAGKHWPRTHTGPSPTAPANPALACACCNNNKGSDLGSLVG